MGTQRIQVEDRTEVAFLVNGEEIMVSIRLDSRGRPCLRVRGDTMGLLVAPTSGNGVDIRPDEVAQ